MSSFNQNPLHASHLPRSISCKEKCVEEESIPESFKSAHAVGTMAIYCIVLEGGNLGPGKSIGALVGRIAVWGEAREVGVSAQ